MSWMFLPIRRYAQFTGRSRRKEFWSFLLLNLLAILLFLAILVAGAASSPDPESPSALAMIATGLYVLWSLFVFIPMLAVQARRLRDQDITPFLVLLNFIPVGGLIVLLLMLRPGTKGPNKHGADPKGDPGPVDQVFA